MTSSGFFALFVESWDTLKTNVLCVSQWKKIMESGSGQRISEQMPEDKEGELPHGG
jgi:hypothetical protein